MVSGTQSVWASNARRSQEAQWQGTLASPHTARYRARGERADERERKRSKHEGNLSRHDTRGKGKVTVHGALPGPGLGAVPGSDCCSSSQDTLIGT